ncbi:thioesterase [Planctomycetales bacterium]|nr:thioesterase [Planctomycetales bacterium]GHT08140.1 thioesterase [Planctomycetales bacterium]GHV23407.1 thioesterase [Planctomycetales bacterium]
MLTLTIEPNISDTDALGHITNTKLPVWFEAARTPYFRLFTPDLNLRRWRLILAHIDVDFIRQIFFGRPVQIYSYTAKIGGKSFTVNQEAWQDGRQCATGATVLVRYDWETEKSVALNDDERALLSAITAGE